MNHHIGVSPGGHRAKAVGRGWLALIAALGVLTGCGEPVSNRTKTAAEDPEFAAQVMRTYEETQAKSTSKLRQDIGPEIDFQSDRAYDNVSLDMPLTDGHKWIAVDMRFRLHTDPEKQLDLEHIACLDGETGKFIDVHPHRVMRLTLDGQPAHGRDPELDGREEYRCLLFFEVPRACQQVKLDYWGELLTQHPLKLEDKPLDLPRPSLKPLSIRSRNVETPDQPTTVCYDVLLECHNCFRTETPIDTELRSLVAGHSYMLPAAACVEVDEDLKPTFKPVKELPLVVPLRRFVVEYRSASPVVPLDVKDGETAYEVPATETLDLPLVTLEALRTAKPPDRHSKTDTRNP